MTQDEFQHYYNLYSTRDAEAAKAEAARVNAIGIDGNSAVAVNLQGEWCLMLKSAYEFAVEHGIIKEEERQQPSAQTLARDTAAHMLMLHRDSSYMARERANDHAMAYDIGQPQRTFWLAVVDAIDALAKEQS